MFIGTKYYLLSWTAVDHSLSFFFSLPLSLSPLFVRQTCICSTDKIRLERNTLQFFKCAPIRIVTWIWLQKPCNNRVRIKTDAFFVLCCDLLHCCFVCSRIFDKIFNDIFSRFSLFQHFKLLLLLLLSDFFSVSAQLIISRIQLHCDFIEIYFTKVIYFKSLLEKPTENVAQIQLDNE